MEKIRFNIGEYEKDGLQYRFSYKGKTYLVIVKENGEERNLYRSNNMREAYSFWKNVKGVKKKHAEVV